MLIEDMSDKQILILPKDKKVAIVEYTDGSAEYFLDLENDLLAVLYQRAAEENITVEEACTKAIEEGLKYMRQDLEDEEI